MIHVLASIRICPGKREQFVKLFKANVPNVLAEHGCVEYTPAVDLDAQLPSQILDENTVTIIEKWESLKALMAHLKAPHMLAYREEVKDIVAYLRIIHNPSDEVSFARIVNTPPRGIGQRTVDELARWSRNHQTTLKAAFQAITDKNTEMVDPPPIQSRAIHAITAFNEIIDTLLKTRHIISMSLKMRFQVINMLFDPFEFPRAISPL